MNRLAATLAAVLFIAPAFASADATTTINARILPIVWYSDLDVREGEALRLFAGIQNNSGRAFSGEVAFYADGSEIGRAPFSSASGELAEASVGWSAPAGGTYSMRAAAFPALPAGLALVESETGSDRLKVARVVTFESVKETAFAVATKVVKKADSVAQALAATAEEKRREVAAAAQPEGAAAAGPAQADTESEVLGTSTERAVASPYAASVYGASLGAASFLLERWRWVAGAASALILFLIFKR